MEAGASVSQAFIVYGRFKTSGIRSAPMEWAHMSTLPASERVGRKLWVGVRFVLFGFVGFWVMLLSSVSLMILIFEHQQEFLSPFLSLPLTGVGALMMLYGVGEWGRWACLWVFLSIPISLCLGFVIPALGSNEDFLLLIAIVAPFGANAGVRAYYAGRA